ncbi:MAG: hypothetical protein ACXV74_13640, partial [Methylobacter sp.]
LAMTRRDVGKPAFSLRKKRFVKTHALSLLRTKNLRYAMLRFQDFQRRIEMQIIEMVLVIQFVTQCVFPKTSLPYAASTVAQTGSRHRLFGTAQSQPMLSEVFLMTPQRFE